MTIQSLTEQIRKKSSFLCVGLDSDKSKLPYSVSQQLEAQFVFNKQIIDATHDLAVAYKINTAFYESDGSEGYQALEKTVHYLNEKYPDHFTIADAKRGDIGNTSTQYAKAFFEKLSFDSVTVAPYMGQDSIEPFLQFEGKYAILLALTSNQGAYDFQTLNTVYQSLYETIIATSRTWRGAERLMYVFGATKSEYLANVRALAPKSFFLKTFDKCILDFPWPLRSSNNTLKCFENSRNCLNQIEELPPAPCTKVTQVLEMGCKWVE